MPSLIRLIVALSLIGGAVYGGIYALAHFVKPNPREMIVTVPPTNFQKR